jgi:hypothetical protein
MKECEQGIVARDRLHHSCCDDVSALAQQGLHNIRALDKTAAEWQAKYESVLVRIEAANLQKEELLAALKDLYTIREDETHAEFFGRMHAIAVRFGIPENVTKKRNEGA